MTTRLSAIATTTCGTLFMLSFGATGHGVDHASPSTLRARAARSRLTVYVGTYTDGTGSQGIYRFTLDPISGEMTGPVLAAKAESPSFLALHPNGRVLYAVEEIERFDGRASGAVAAFAIDRDTGDLALINRQASEGAAPCHLVVDRAGRHVLVANYGGGNLAVFPIAPDGALRPASSVLAHSGSGPNRERQQAPHAHGIGLDAAQHFAISPDLGADRVFVHRYDAEKGTLAVHGAGTPPPGSGPRHATLDAPGRRLYTLNELTSTITVFAYDAAAGTLTPGHTLSTLPAGFTGENWTAEIALAPDGRHLYASNRGHDSIAVFDVDQAAATLTLKGHLMVGRTPRHFAIDPTGQWLLVGHQGAGSIAVHRIDATTGLAAPATATLAMARPVCLLVVPRQP
jgi:6-phosphogluconolactonase